MVTNSQINEGGASGVEESKCWVDQGPKMQMNYEGVEVIITNIEKMRRLSSRQVDILWRLVWRCADRHRHHWRTFARSNNLSVARGGSFMPTPTRRLSNAKGIHEEEAEGAVRSVVMQVGINRYFYFRYHKSLKACQLIDASLGCWAYEYSVGNGPMDILKRVFADIRDRVPVRTKGNRFLKFIDDPEDVVYERPNLLVRAHIVGLQGKAHLKGLSGKRGGLLADFRLASSSLVNKTKLVGANISYKSKHAKEVIAGASASVGGKLGVFIPRPEKLVARWRKLKASIVYRPAVPNQPSLEVIMQRKREVARYHKVGMELNPAPLVGNYTIVKPRMLFRCFGMRPVEFLDVEFQAAFEARLESYDEVHIATIDAQVLAGSSLRPHEERDADASATFVTEYSAVPANPTEGWEEVVAGIDRLVVVKKHKRHHRINYSSHEAIAAARVKFPYVDGLVAELVGPRNLAIRHFISEKLVEMDWRIVDIASHLDEFVLIVNLPSSQTIAVRDLTKSSVAALRRAGAAGSGESVSV